MHLAPPVPRDVKALQGMLDSLEILARREIAVIPVQRAGRVVQVQAALLALRAGRVLQGSQARVVLQAPRVTPVGRAQQVPQVLLGRLGPAGPLALRAGRATRVQLAGRVGRATQATQVSAAPLVLVGRQVRQVLQEQQQVQVPRDRRASQVELALPVCQVKPLIREPRVLQEMLVQPDIQENKEILVKWVQTAMMDQRGPQVFQDRPPILAQRDLLVFRDLQE